MHTLRQPEDVPKIISLQLLSEITDNFSEERKLGTGTYGKVYKGVQNGTEIAVKMLHLTPGDDDHEQFKKEFENLTRLKHLNIVQLLGYCYEVKYEYIDLGGGRTVFAQNIYRALCFEYMQNGSLQEHLSDEQHGLDWQARYRIIKGICKGLEYLHEGLESPIYHLDLKPDNILLDKNMVPKLADFGLSKLVSNNQTRATQSALGTMGYLPPEYIEQNLVSIKFDIFSLGVIMIRIITGYEGYYKKAEMPSEEFIDLVQKNWRERLQATPGCISLEDECHQVKQCIEIALDCVKADRNQRPEIGTIIHRLNETDQMNENLGMYSLHKTRDHIVSQIEEARSSVSNLVNELSSIDVAAAPSQLQQINSVPDRPIEKSTEASSFVSTAPSPLQRTTGVLDEPGETTRKILSDQSSAISKLLDVHPLEPRFPWEPNRKITCPVTVTNRTDRYLGVWIRSTCEDTSSNISFTFDDTEEDSEEGSEEGNAEYAPSIFQATMGPHSTMAIAVNMKSQWKPPPNTMLEVLVVVIRSATRLEELVSCIEIELGIDNEFLKTVKKLGGQVHRAMLKVGICDPASCQTVIQDQKSIPAPSEFWKIDGIDVHRTKTWVLAHDGNGQVSILNYETQNIEMVMQVIKQGSRELSSAKFIAEEQWFAIGDTYGWVHVYSYTTKRKVMGIKAHESGHYGVVLAIHPTSPYLLTLCPGEHSIKLWDWSEGWKCTQKFKNRLLAEMINVIWNPMDSDTFITISSDVMMVWNSHSSDLIIKLEGQFNPSSCWLYRDGHQDFMVTTIEWKECAHVWDMQKRKHVHEFFLCQQKISNIACHPTLPILVTQFENGTIGVWDATTYRLVQMVDNDTKAEDMVLIRTKDSTRLILEYCYGISVVELNLPALEITDLHTDDQN